METFNFKKQTWRNIQDPFLIARKDEPRTWMEAGGVRAIVTVYLFKIDISLHDLLQRVTGK